MQWQNSGVNSMNKALVDALRELHTYAETIADDVERGESGDDQELIDMLDTKFHDVLRAM